MANNCYNYIEIIGDKNQLKDLYTDLVLDPKTGCDSGCDIYENICHKYGKGGNDARWFDMDVQLYENEIIISGDSAWCPCLEIFTEISSKFPELSIRYSYEEMGVGFAGWADIENGECNDNEFGYWEGIIKREGESEALCMVLENELECYESEEELKKSEMYLSFSEESRSEILESYKGTVL